MRILIHCTHYGEPWNEGVKNIVRRLIGHLRDAGDEAYVAARSLTSAELGAMEVGRSPLVGFAHVGELARAHQVDVVHSIQSLTALTGLRGLAIKGAGPIPLLLHLTGLGRWPSAHRLGISPDAVVVGSPYLQRYYPAADVIYAVPALDDITPLGPPPGDQPPVIGFLGAFEPERGVETLIEACARLRSAALAFSLRLAWNGVGGRAGRDRVVAMARSSGVPFELEGTVDIREFYRRSRVIVIPRRSMKRMTLPLRVIECALVQRPVVVSRILGMDQVVGGMGASFTPGDPEALAEALTPILSDESAYATCVRQAATRRAEFLPEVSLERLRQIYRRLGS